MEPGGAVQEAGIEPRDRLIAGCPTDQLDPSPGEHELRLGPTMRPILRLLAIVTLVIAVLGAAAFVAGLAGGNPAQLLVGVAVAIVATAMAAALLYADRAMGGAPSSDRLILNRHVPTAPRHQDGGRSGTGSRRPPAQPDGSNNRKNGGKVNRKPIATRITAAAT